MQQKYAKKDWYCCCHFVICWCCFLIFFVDKLNIYELNCHWSLEDPLQSSSFLCQSEIQNVQMWNQTEHDYSLDGPLQSLDISFNMEFKMAATAWLGLTLDPMGKCFKRHLGQLKLNLETELRRNVFGASGERYRLLRVSGLKEHSWMVSWQRQAVQF